MKRWIVFVALLWIAIWSAAPARADGFHYDDSHPDLIILGDADHYEIGLRKSNGSIAYITDKTTGRSVTRGSRYGCLWGASFPDGTPSFVGGCHDDTAGPNRFSHTWSASTQTLTLTYAPNPNAGQRVAAQVRVKPSVGSSLDIQLQLRNDWGHALDWVLFPGDTVFAEAESREAAIAGTPGALDTTFDPGTGANDTVFAVAQQPDGKVLVGGQFTQFNGAARHRIARLEADGSLSGAYNPSVTGAGFAGVVSLALQSDGKTVIGGLFSQVNGVAYANIARLKADGSLDPAFNPGTGVTGTDAYLNTVTLQSDGKALIGGVFTRYNGTSRNNIARLTTAGALDTTFNPGSGTRRRSRRHRRAAGRRQGVDRRLVHRRERHHPQRDRPPETNGSLDSAFNSDVNGSVLAIAVQGNHKILIGGAFTTVNGVRRNRIARLNADGTLDTTFDPAAGPSGEVDALALQPDGKIVIGGKFTSVGGVERKRIARLKPDGALDASFDPGTGATWTVFAVTLQPDGRVLIGGAFEAIDGVSRSRIARLWGDYRTFLPLVLRQ